ncbi:MAG TPA: DUF4418 family protein [Nitrospirota bacterium]|nr:DUF4418 family protein [Nitrospirota bacterium]
MKTLIVVSALMSGILLILVPRFILPVCEYEGYPAMHCSDTARAEYVVGVLFLAAGIGAFLLKSTRTAVISAVVSIILYIIAFLLPDKYGYCKSSRMPCNYGTVPGIRFVAIIGGIIMVVAIISLVRSTRKKGNT